jgi:hypothetical protein
MFLPQQDYAASIAMCRPFEDSDIEFEGEITLKKLSVWIEANRFGACPILLKKDFASFRQYKRPLTLAVGSFDFTNNEEESNRWRNVLLDVGRELDSSQASFAVGNADEFAEFVDNIDGYESLSNAVKVIAFDAQHQATLMKEDFSTSAVRKFVKSQNLFSKFISIIEKSDERKKVEEEMCVDYVLKEIRTPVVAIRTLVGNEIAS